MIVNYYSIVSILLYNLIGTHLKTLCISVSDVHLLAYWLHLGKKVLCEPFKPQESQ